jgi:phosphoribosyl 1,2-cyclic phosphate phosphodiesterase
MRLRFLGTAAAEGYPDLFCDCENCRAAREKGGKSLRRRASALIDEVLLIDPGPDLHAAALHDGFSFAGLRYCLQTHEHSDHLDPLHFFSRAPMCQVKGHGRLEYFATEGALAKAAAGVGLAATGIGLAGGFLDPATADRWSVTARPVAPFQEVAVGPYRVRPVSAFHDPKITPLLYLIERDGRCLFYATDTGELPAETWADLEAQAAAGRRVHVVAMDHTFGMAGRVQGHMNWEQFTEQAARMRAIGLLADGARVFAHHIAHHSNPPHEALSAFAASHGYEVAYDGLEVEV